jgi:hypothetical protein
MVPTVFTIDDIVHKEAGENYDAYIRLVMIELQKVSSVDAKGDITLLFSKQNAAYLDVVLAASNVRAFMRRVLAKTAYLLDHDPDKKYIAREAELAALGQYCHHSDVGRLGRLLFTLAPSHRQQSL